MDKSVDPWVKTCLNPLGDRVYPIPFPLSLLDPCPALRPKPRSLVFKLQSPAAFSAGTCENLVPQGGVLKGWALRFLWDFGCAGLQRKLSKTPRSGHKTPKPSTALGSIWATLGNLCLGFGL